jgi:hypothetical protein
MKTKESRLSLDMETLRELTPEDARQVNGGGGVVVSSAVLPGGGGAVVSSAVLPGGGGGGLTVHTPRHHRKHH